MKTLNTIFTNNTTTDKFVGCGNIFGNINAKNFAWDRSMFRVFKLNLGGTEV